METKNEIKNPDQFQGETKLLTLSEFRRELGIPLVLAKKLIVWGEVEAVKALDGTLRIAAPEVAVARAVIGTPLKKTYLFVRALGPGLITGASDDDPGGIGTYSSVGAQFGMGILWMAAWLLPMMLAIQETCARIGIVTNKGLAAVLKEHFTKKTVMTAVLLLTIANVANIGADLGAMAASLNMITGIDFAVGAVAFAVIIILLEIFVKYHVYVKVLKWLTLSVFAYIVAGVMTHPDWLNVFKNSFLPQISFTKEYIFAMIAVFGTTITPYLFFWQASEEVEDGKMNHALKNKKAVRTRVSAMRTDVNAGMILANIVFFFIVLTTANVLFANGITNIDSAQDAALALKPLAGNYAFLLFAIGIIGTGFLAVPILAGSGAYALSELMNWNNGLEEKYSDARGFYLVITFSIIVGLAMNFLGINPIKALYWSAFLNGIIALPLLAIIMKIGGNKKIMGKETNPAWVKICGWAAVVSMFSAVVVMMVLQFS
ncbi:MAG: natural resistance-associated macrophage protein [uncultured bacterium]|nr:MAG: natural resistance-associated macrophage protein [uncultured bacterium]